MLVLAFSVVACDKPCTDHVDADGDGVCDTPGCYEGLKPDGENGGSGGSGSGSGIGDGTETPIIPIKPEY